MTQRLNDAQFVEKLTAVQLRLRSYAISLVRSPSDADDILQNASLTLWNKRGDYDATREFFPWACGIVLIEVHRHRRKYATDKLMFSGPLIDTLAAEYVEQSDELENRVKTLQKCVAKLDEKDRVLLKERYASGFKPKEMSRRRGCPITTLYSALSRIRGLLQRCVESTLAQEAHR
ncbi:RNA polymerase sigma factor [Posidoniimonas corsicana]|uniref:RNA polymerase sigma factor n=1 Tax=Posidoniimonas corsicana TaxID=1938618 RepID=A0A5C5VAP3_9BACT|nr:sigma-70 family RNA polymerase sigma factor [Posidoniimonas corsicana]TWT35381.1 RNA polymerase sigma factor [Posidoniimonas corsicana]